MADQKMNNPNVPLFNGTIADSIAAGGFPLHINSKTIFGLAKFFENIFGPAMLVFQDVMMTYLPEATKMMKQWVDETIHPLSRGFPLTDPVDVLFCIVMYFVFLAFFFIVGRITGKLTLRGFGILHNLFLTVLSLYMGVGILWDMLALYGPSVWNNSLDASHPLALGQRNMGWIFAASKLPEYIDTYIMVLKHNYRQVSFLHLYHHCSIYIVSYVFFVYAPGADNIYAGMVNSLIHVIMYIYYLLNLIFRHGPVKEFLQRNKFIITRCQITQFVANFLQTVYILSIADPVRCQKGPMWINFFYMISMITLFYNFMVQNQKLAAARKKEAALKHEKKTK